MTVADAEALALAEACANAAPPAKAPAAAQNPKIKNFFMDFFSSTTN
jgi:hypothetical protein